MMPNDADGPDQHLLEVAHVPMHVAPIRFQVDDGIANELAGAVIRDISATPGLEEPYAGRRERLRCREDVRSIVAGPDAERHDGGMLEEQQLIGNQPSLAVVDELLLKVEPFLIPERSEPPYIHPSSNFSSRSLMNERNRPASAPSINRWS